MRDCTQPFDSDHLTTVEETVNDMQKKKVCTNCGNAQIHQRGGARQCVEDDPDCPETLDVMAGRVICRFWV